MTRQNRLRAKLSQDQGPGVGKGTPGPRLCDVEGCQRVHKGHGYCATHLARWYRHGSPHTIGRSNAPAPVHPPGPDHPNWKGDEITYHAAHARLYRTRGPARDQLCAACGQQANFWVYDGTDPKVRHQEIRWGQRRPYSPDPHRYLSLCHRCRLLYRHGKLTVTRTGGRVHLDTIRNC